MRDCVNPRMPFVQNPAGDPSRASNYLEIRGLLASLIHNSSRVLEYASSGASDSASKIKILCSFGGKILPRPSDGKLRYVRGNTRIIHIRDFFWQELRQKMLEIYIETYAVKYQLPGEDLDALVSVSSDEDLQNMIEEEYTNVTHANSGGDHEFQFVVAVNGMDMGSRRESSMHGLMRSSGNNLSELDGQNVERNISRAATEFVGSIIPPLNLSNLNSSISMPELSNAYENPNQMHHIELGYNIQQHLAPETSAPLNSNGFVDRQGEFTEGHPSRAPVMQNRQPQNPNGLVDRQGDFIEGHPSRAPVMQNRQPQNPNGLVDRQREFTEGHPSRAPVMQNRQPQNLNGLVDRQGEFTEGQPSRAPVMQNRQPQNPNGLVDRQGDFTEGHPSRAPVMQNRQPQKEEKPKGDNSAQQEVKQTIIRSPRDEMASSTLPSEGSDLIDLSYLKPPPRVYHSERIPRGQVEKNRLTKSDDSLGSHLLASHLQSDVEPQDFVSESVGSLHNENLRAEDRPAVNNDQVSDAANTSDVKTATGVTGSGVKVQEEILIDINDRFPSDFLSDVFTRAMAEDWSFFQKLAGDEFRQKDVSLIDQDRLAFLSRLQNVQEEASVGYNASQFPDDVDSRNTFIEDEGKEIPGSESKSMQPHYNPSHKSIEGMQFNDPSENTRMPDSEYEVSTRNDGVPSIDLSLGDVDICSMQIIRNEDLEELRELGSGTFVTVYHGKWRGTDVAIKRLKKSCFTGRSSEQERLTIDFWREADILSKLHHPNVMVFYGVVQDGPDGTLATVTEFMGDGSLGHVLLRKDRSQVKMMCCPPPPPPPFFLFSKIKSRVDVFSFGIVLWEILTREKPYANMHYGAIIGGIVNNTLRPTIPSDCDPEWTRLMELRDMEYKELALEAGVENWGRVLALGCTSTFIIDLADAVIEALPFATAMTPSTSERMTKEIEVGNELHKG
nr:kinase superfamily with octicosapeptide/Phox/Bem1p domain-containing protein [Tanacetum cinerariifolium]